MVPLGLADRLSVTIAHGAEDTLHVTGDPGPPRPDDLVLRAINAARQAVGRGAATPALAARLEKRIPIAAGLAGGSSDAAAAVEAALEAWGADLGREERARVAAGLGSDVPFFLAGGPALVEGRGERVTPLAPIDGEPGVLLVCPSARASTPAVFEAFDAGGPAAAADAGSTRRSSEDLAEELRAGLRVPDLIARAGILATANDLANAAAVVVPGLRDLRRGLLRMLARPIGVSGSGPTLWALYPSVTEAEREGEAIRLAFAERRLDAPGEEPPAVFATTISSNRSAP